MSRSTWWTLAVLAVATALVAALVIELRREPVRPDRGAPVPAVAQDLTVLRERAGLPPCRDAPDGA
ncbi:MAG: TlpA family protein disulfide reductase, partial [Mycolicibacter algericus]